MQEMTNYRKTRLSNIFLKEGEEELIGESSDVCVILPLIKEMFLHMHVKWTVQ